MTAFSRDGILPQGEHASPDDKQYDPPVIPQEVGNRDQDHGGEGKGLPKIIEYADHFGDDGDQEKGEDADTDDDGLSLAGRRVMQAIGEYSHWGILK